MNTQQRMLAAIRSQLGRQAAAVVPPPPPVLPMPATAKDQDVATFAQRLSAVGGVVHRVPAATAANTVRGLLRELGCRRGCVSDAEPARALVGELGDVSWLRADAPRTDLLAADVGVTAAWLGIAETGTLVLRGDLERSRQVSLLPPVHVALLPVAALVGTLGEALARLPRPLPPAVTFVTGPSRTADIELQLVVGVHGPRQLHVLLLAP